MMRCNEMVRKQESRAFGAARFGDLVDFVVRGGSPGVPREAQGRPWEVPAACPVGPELGVDP